MPTVNGLRLPDFLIIGAGRCGTTSLSKYLAAHPQVYLPSKLRPEPHFFMKQAEYEKGLAYYSHRYFEGVPDDVRAGEKSVSYLFQPYVPDRIRTHLPWAKMVVMLRNPMDRAYSSYHFTCKNGLETMPFSEAIRAEPERIAHPASPEHAEIQPFTYIGRSRYAEQLRRYTAIFPPEQLHVALLDDFVADPQAEYRRVLAFLGVDIGFVPKTLGVTYNVTHYQGAEMTEADRAYLRDQLADDIADLSRLLGRDLSCWT